MVRPAYAYPAQRSETEAPVPPKADIGLAGRDVRFVPKADMPTISSLREAADCPRHGLRISFSISVVG